MRSRTWEFEIARVGPRLTENTSYMLYGRRDASSDLLHGVLCLSSARGEKFVDALDTFTRLRPVAVVAPLIDRIRTYQDVCEHGEFGRASKLTPSWDMVTPTLRINRYGKWKVKDRDQLARSCTQRYWGPLCVRNVDTSQLFWALADEVREFEDDWLQARDMLVKGFGQSRMFTLAVQETPAMFRHLERCNPLFTVDTWYVLPCICILDTDSLHVQWVWVHPRARDRGFAKSLLSSLGCTAPTSPPSDSVMFWKRVLPS